MIKVLRIQWANCMWKDLVKSKHSVQMQVEKEALYLADNDLRFNPSGAFLPSCWGVEKQHTVQNPDIFPLRSCVCSQISPGSPFPTPVQKLSDGPVTVQGSCHQGLGLGIIFQLWHISNLAHYGHARDMTVWLRAWSWLSQLMAQPTRLGSFLCHPLSSWQMKWCGELSSITKERAIASDRDKTINAFEFQSDRICFLGTGLNQCVPCKIACWCVVSAV